VNFKGNQGTSTILEEAGPGVCVADDGGDNLMDEDLVVANNGDPLLLLHNRGGTGNHFLNIKLVGTKSNRDATGARVRVRTGGISQIRVIMAGGSYLSHSDLRAHFGLGQSSRAESVEVSWASGLRQAFPDVAADRFYVIEKGKDQLTPQKSIPPR
jgi:hypothetical protein